MTKTRLEFQFKDFKTLLKMWCKDCKVKKKNGKSVRYISKKDAIKAVRTAYEMGGNKTDSSHMNGSVVMSNTSNLATEAARLANEAAERSNKQTRELQTIN